MKKTKKKMLSSISLPFGRTINFFVCDDKMVVKELKMLGYPEKSYPTDASNRAGMSYGPNNLQHAPFIWINTKAYDMGGYDKLLQTCLHEAYHMIVYLITRQYSIESEEFEACLSADINEKIINRIEVFR